MFIRKVIRAHSRPSLCSSITCHSNGETPPPSATVCPPVLFNPIYANSGIRITNPFSHGNCVMRQSRAVADSLFSHELSQIPLSSTVPEVGISPPTPSARFLLPLDCFLHFSLYINILRPSKCFLMACVTVHSLRCEIQTVASSGKRTASRIHRMVLLLYVSLFYFSLKLLG